jgi:hypothetical protein
MEMTEQQFAEEILNAMSKYYKQMVSCQIKERIAAKNYKKLPTA